MEIKQRNGFTITWMDKDGHEDSFESESYTEVERKRRELKSKRIKVSEIMQCIF